MSTLKKEFIVRRDSTPMKLLYMEPQRVTAFIRRLQSRFPVYNWSVSEHFLLNGSD